MHEQLKTDNLNTSAINSFLEDVTGVINPKVRWGALKYKTKRMYSFGTSDIKYVAKRLIEHNHDWGHEIFFSLRARTETPLAAYKKPQKKRSAKTGKLYQPRKKWHNRLPGCFVLDVDCGTSDTEVKNSRLLDCLKKTESRACLPTHIVYTRNGFHFYWAIKAALSEVQTLDPEAIWREVQKTLAEIYGGDTKIVGPNQMMRLPGFYHWKNESLGFPVQFIRTEATEQNLDHILSAHGLKPLSQRFADAFGVDSGTNPSKVHRKTIATPKPSTEDTQSDIRNADPASESVELDIYKAVNLALLKGKHDLVALKRYLNVDHESCACPFHDDDTPSARLFKTENGAFFKCHSNNCTVDFLDLTDAIRLKERIKGRNLVIRTLEALNRVDLARRLQGKNVPPLKILQQIYENEKFLQEAKHPPIPFSSGIPLNYGTLKWIKPFLADFLALAKKKLRNREGTFLASLKEISKRKDPKRAAIKLYLLRLSGLVELAEMPEECRASLERFKASNKVFNDTSWHRIPLWTQESFDKAMNTLAFAYSQGINTRSCTRKQVREAFGPETEARVFFGVSTQGKGYNPEWDDILEEQQRQLEMILSLTDEEIDRAFNPNRPDNSTEETLNDESEVA